MVTRMQIMFLKFITKAQCCLAKVKLTGMLQHKDYFHIN